LRPLPASGRIWVYTRPEQIRERQATRFAASRGFQGHATDGNTCANPAAGAIAREAARYARGGGTHA